MTTPALLLRLLLLLLIGRLGRRVSTGHRLGHTGRSSIATPQYFCSSHKSEGAVSLSASKSSPPVTILKLSSGRPRDQREYRCRISGITGTGGMYT